MLDRQDYDAWLDPLTEDIHYFMPIRVTTALGAGYDTSPGMAHFDEDKYSLCRRVARFATEHAWTEDPPSRLRHHLSNVRTFATEDDEHLVVESAVLLFRSRGDVREPSLVSAGRVDLLRQSEGWRWPVARSSSTSRFCACRTWRSSCDAALGGRGRGRRSRPAGRERGAVLLEQRVGEPILGQRVRRGAGAAGRHPQRRPAAHRIAEVRPVGGTLTLWSSRR